METTPKKRTERGDSLKSQRIRAARRGATIKERRSDEKAARGSLIKITSRKFMIKITTRKYVFKITSQKRSKFVNNAARNPDVSSLNYFSVFHIETTTRAEKSSGGLQKSDQGLKEMTVREDSAMEEITEGEDNGEESDEHETEKISNITRNDIASCLADLTADRWSRETRNLSMSLLDLIIQQQEQESQKERQEADTTSTMKVSKVMEGRQEILENVKSGQEIYEDSDSIIPVQKTMSVMEKISLRGGSTEGETDTEVEERADNQKKETNIKYLMKKITRLLSRKFSIPVLKRKNFQMIKPYPLMKTHPHLKKEQIETYPGIILY